jgi:hypothetical protein
MFGRALQSPSRSQREMAGSREGRKIIHPHRAVTIKATAILAFEGHAARENEFLVGH